MKTKPTYTVEVNKDSKEFTSLTELARYIAYCLREGDTVHTWRVNPPSDWGHL